MIYRTIAFAISITLASPAIAATGVDWTQPIIAANGKPQMQSDEPDGKNAYPVTRGMIAASCLMSWRGKGDQGPALNALALKIASGAAKSISLTTPEWHAIEECLTQPTLPAMYLGQIAPLDPAYKPEPLK